MWNLVLAGLLLNPIDQCTQELGGSPEARLACETPNTTIDVKKQIYFIDQACKSIRLAMKEKGLPPSRIEIKAANGYTASCTSGDDRNVLHKRTDRPLQDRNQSR